MPEQPDARATLQFEPDTFITLDEPGSGKRLLALVTEQGNECLLYLDEEEPATPVPLLPSLRPQPLDDYETLQQRLIDEGVEDAEAFAPLIDEIWEKLEPYDDLTFMRCVLFAYESHAFDLDVAVHVGLMTSAKAREQERALLEYALGQAT